MEARAQLSLDGRLLASEPPPAQLRDLLLDGRIDKLRVTFLPCLARASSDLTLSGSSDLYLPASLEYRLISLHETEDGAEAVYIPANRGA